MSVVGGNQAEAVIAVRQEDREDILPAAEQIGVPALASSNRPI